MYFLLTRLWCMCLTETQVHHMFRGKLSCWWVCALMWNFLDFPTNDRKSLSSPWRNMIVWRSRPRTCGRIRGKGHLTCSYEGLEACNTHDSFIFWILLVKQKASGVHGEMKSFGVGQKAKWESQRYYHKFKCFICRYWKSERKGKQSQ